MSKPRTKMRTVAVHKVRRWAHRSPRLVMTGEIEEWTFETVEVDDEELAPPPRPSVHVPKLLR